jgi:hypothetical protein
MADKPRDRASVTARLGVNAAIGGSVGYLASMPKALSMIKQGQEMARVLGPGRGVATIKAGFAISGKAALAGAAVGALATLLAPSAANADGKPKLNTAPGLPPRAAPKRDAIDSINDAVQFVGGAAMAGAGKGLMASPSNVKMKLAGGALVAIGGVSAAVAVVRASGSAKADDGKSSALPDLRAGDPRVKAEMQSSFAGGALGAAGVAVVGRAITQGRLGLGLAGGAAILAGLGVVIRGQSPAAPMISGATASAPADGAFMNRAAQIAAQTAAAPRAPSAPIGASSPTGPAQRTSYTTVDGRTVEATEAQAKAWAGRRN